VDVAVLKSQMFDVRRLQWWTLTTVAGFFLTLVGGIVLLVVTGGLR
jgi:hypothetical protein